jgi:hypothetical protein
VRALRRRRSPKSLIGLHHDALLPVLRCRVTAGAMDGPSRCAPGALRRKALKVLPKDLLKRFRRRAALIAANTRRPSFDRHPLRRRHHAYQLQHWRSALDPHKMSCHKMQLS